MRVAAVSRQKIKDMRSTARGLASIARFKRTNGWSNFQKFNKTSGNGILNRTMQTSSQNEEVPSYLFVPKHKADKLASVLSPVLNWSFSPMQIQEIQENLQRRRKPPVDVEDLAKQWHRRTELKADFQRLEDERNRNTELVRQKLESGSTKEDLEPLLEEGRRLRSTSKAVDLALSMLEEGLVPRLLQLPNVLHPTTPKEHQKIINVHGLRPTFESCDHTNIGLSGDWLHFTEAGLGGYYLKGCWAIAELATLDFFADRFLVEDFVPFSNPDFCKPLVVEGCGQHFGDPNETFHLKADVQGARTELHLVGSASLLPFAAFYTKCSVNEEHFPLRHFAMGRRYMPLGCGVRQPSLFETSQASQLHFFAAVADDAMQIYEQCLRITESIYIELDVRFRTVHIAAANLLEAEIRRTEIQMWSSSLQAYHTVASISACSDYISKRLWMCYEKQGHSRGFMQVVHGTAISFPEFLACLMESNLREDDFGVFPSNLLPYMSIYGTNK